MKIFQVLQIFFRKIWQKDRLSDVHYINLRLKGDLHSLIAPFLTNTPTLEELPVKGKKIGLIVAHADDELIFGSTIITNSTWEKLLIVLCFDPGHRKSAIEGLCEKVGAELVMLNLPETRDEEGRTNLSPITEKMEKDCSAGIRDILSTWELDIVITHNLHGEYGHRHHQFVFQIVRKQIILASEVNAQLYLFGFVPPVYYRSDGKTPWYKSLTAFTKFGFWAKFSPHTIVPFFGIFAYKKFEGYFLSKPTHKLSIDDRPLLNSLLDNYRGIEDWWMHPDGYLWDYCTHGVQFFQRYPFENDCLQVRRWPIYQITQNYPLTKKNPEAAKFKKDIIRSFHDIFLLDHLSLTGRVLWVGWNEFCQRSNYKHEVLKTASKFEILDKAPSRKDIELYNGEIADFIGDCCDLSEIIATDSFDFVHFWGVLEYVDDMSSAISEIMRITKAGGRVLIGTPGVSWTSTGKNRPNLFFLVNAIQANRGEIIELWHQPYPEYFAIHVYKKRPEEVLTDG